VFSSAVIRPRTVGPGDPKITTAMTSLRHDFFDRRAKVNLQPLLAGHFEPAWIESQLVQYGRVNIGYIVAILYGGGNLIHLSHRG